ncbi:MAG: hypothetical protein EBS90_11960 [Betaproteobacteria bacterium]|nr:hypothetical protein [Betaproteobacteria bacterium]
MNPHFVEMLRAFRDEGVEHLVIGAHALAAHGYVRATLDIDIWVRPSAENAARIWRALERFRAPLTKMKPDDFAEREVLYQIGVPPSRIDIMTSVTGLEFDAAWSRRIMAAFGDIDVPVLGGQDLRTAKRAAGRLKDLADLEELG